MKWDQINQLTDQSSITEFEDRSFYFEVILLWRSGIVSLLFVSLVPVNRRRCRNFNYCEIEVISLLRAEGELQAAIFYWSRNVDGFTSRPVLWLETQSGPVLDRTTGLRVFTPCCFLCTPQQWSPLLKLFTDCLLVHAGHSTSVLTAAPPAGTVTNPPCFDGPLQVFSRNIWLLGGVLMYSWRWWNTPRRAALVVLCL